MAMDKTLKNLDTVDAFASISNNKLNGVVGRLLEKFLV
jgi:hypothetical protein